MTLVEISRWWRWTLAICLEWRRILDRSKDLVTPEQFLFQALRTDYRHSI